MKSKIEMLTSVLTISDIEYIKFLAVIGWVISIFFICYLIGLGLVYILDKIFYRPNPHKIGKYRRGE